MKSYMGKTITASDRFTHSFLCINNCGIYTGGGVDTLRKKGRTDHLFMYILVGEITAYTKSGALHGKKNDIIYIPPNTPYDSKHKQSKECVYGFIHFGGSASKEIMTKFDFSKPIHMKNGNRILDLIHSMTVEMQTRHPFYEEKCIAYFMNVIAEIGRNQDSDKNQKTKDKILSIAGEIQLEFTKNIPVSEYAFRSRLTVQHFSKMFKKYVGLSPTEYITQLRMNKASELLLQSDMSLKEISNFLGYADSLYFSKVFKKYFGISPFKYKNNV